MKAFTKISTIFAFAMLVLALPAIASAQYRDRDRDDDYYSRDRNDDYNRRNRNDDDDYNRRNRNDNDYYRNGNYNRNLRGVVERLRNRARNFERQTDRYDDRRDDRWGSNRSSNLEGLADRFARATDDLADAYGRGRNMNNSRDEARRVLEIGSQIENTLYRGRSRGGNGMSAQWNQISNDLRILADAYNLGSYNGNRNGDWRSRVPFPLPF